MNTLVLSTRLSVDRFDAAVDNLALTLVECRDGRIVGGNGLGMEFRQVLDEQVERMICQ